MSKNKYSPTKTPQGIGFFKHCMRNHVTPYGLADLAPDEDTIFARIYPFTSEWLIRPKVAMSELSETTTANLDLLQSHSSTIGKDIEQMTEAFQPLIPSLETLFRDSATKPTKHDVVNVIKFMIADNNKLDGLVDRCCQLGNALFTLSINYIIARTMVRNPNRYANNVQATNRSDADFKMQPNLKAMRDFLVANCAPAPQSQGEKPARKRMVQELLSDDHDSSEPTTSAQSPKPTRKRKSNTALLLREIPEHHSDSDTSSSSQEILKKIPSKAKAKKTSNDNETNTSSKKHTANVSTSGDVYTKLAHVATTSKGSSSKKKKHSK